MHQERQQMKYEIIHPQLVYYLYCFKFGYDVGSCIDRARYQKWLKEETLVHCGDCTKQPCPCERCTLQQLEIEAQMILDHLRVTTDNKGIGWCNNKCLENCPMEIPKDENN